MTILLVLMFGVFAAYVAATWPVVDPTDDTLWDRRR